MIAIAPTDLEWFSQLRSITAPKLVNFWTPTPWNVKRLGNEDQLYFLLKSPIRKIGGYGTFSHYENLSVEEAWRKYGLGNGVQSLSELVTRTSSYVEQRTKRGQIDAAAFIGCIVLNKVVFLDDNEFFDPSSRGFDFPRQVVKIKYFDTPRAISNTSVPGGSSLIPSTIAPYELVTKQQKQKRQGLSVVRTGQSRFRNTVLEAYGRRCAVSGESVEEILEAAHIQPYAGPFSDHVQNGIALRTDLHRLFDAGLFTIDPDHRVRVSSLIASAHYQAFDKQLIRLPNEKQKHPSVEALKFHQLNVYRA